MKKRIITILALAAVAAITTGCGKTETSENSASTPAMSSAVDDTLETIESTTAAKVTTTAVTENKNTSVTTTQTTTVASNSSSESSVDSSSSNESSEAQPQDTPVDSESSVVQDEPAVNNTSDEPATEAPAVSNASFSHDDMTFSYNGASTTVMADASGLVSALGQPNETMSSPSCYYEGDDKTYIYNDISIYTYPQNGQDMICEITLTGASYSTPKGLKVGMTLSDAEAIYGTGYTLVSGMYCYYDASNTYMYFTLSGDSITSIGYVVEL